MSFVVTFLFISCSLWGWSFLFIHSLAFVGSTKYSCPSNTTFLIPSEPSPATFSLLPALPPPSSLGPLSLGSTQNPSFCAYSMMSFCSPVKESTDNNHQVELDQTGEKPTFPCCHEWQRRCFVVHWARKVSEAACGEGNNTDSKGNVWFRPAAQMDLLAFILHGPTDLC